MIKKTILLAIIFSIPAFAGGVLEKYKPAKEDNVRPRKLLVKKSTQHFSVENGQEVIATISNVESNRISLTNDRILSVVNADLQSFNIQNNSDTGDLFLLPNIETQRPQNIFISTEKGYTYKLILAPKRQISQQIILNNGATNKLKKVEYKSDYYSFISNQIRALALSHNATNIIQTKKTSKMNIQFIHQKNIDGLVFFKGKIKNISGFLLKLNNNSLPYQNRRAIWLETKTLGINETTAFVIVIAKDTNNGS